MNFKWLVIKNDLLSEIKKIFTNSKENFYFRLINSQYCYRFVLVNKKNPQLYGK